MKWIRSIVVSLVADIEKCRNYRTNKVQTAKKIKDQNSVIKTTKNFIGALKTISNELKFIESTTLLKPKAIGNSTNRKTNDSS
jgi:hypothetical protein